VPVSTTLFTENSAAVPDLTEPYDSGRELEFWRSPREMPAWAVSLLIHLSILFILASITRITIFEQDFSVTSTQVEDLESEEYKIDSTVVDQVGSDSDINIAGPSLAAAQRTGLETHRELQEKLDEKLLALHIPVVDAMPTPSEAELVEVFDAVGLTEHTGGTSGAIDRLTQEIAASLRERKTFVVWLFDESKSMLERRTQIADRFENIYRQLGVLEAAKDRALKTAVVSFGKEIHIHTPDPVDDVPGMIATVRNIPEDGSGTENVFTAVDTVFRRWLTYRRQSGRNMMIILVTDERGDDYAMLEDVINPLRRYGIKVYCVGNAAVFGREKGYIRTTWTAEGQTYTEDLPADQGPETVAAERLQLPFWNPRNREYERMSSGYGPYAITRLCAETGGLYLLAQDTVGRRFSPDVMANYLPDYRPISEYERELRINRAKGALIMAAQQTRVRQFPRPRLNFLANTDTVLRQQIAEAQKPFALVDHHLEQMQMILERGDPDRQHLDSPRWRASFDLAMGRILATRVRTFGYNKVLADMKSEPKTFETDSSNAWRLVSSEELTAGAQVRKWAEKAKEYLTRVVDEHAGTPWALLAEVELSDPMGWSWRERTIQIAANTPGDRGNNVQLAPEEQEQQRRQRERSRIQAASRPKL